MAGDDTARTLQQRINEALAAIGRAVDPGVQYEVEENLGTIPEPRPEAAPHGMQIVDRFHEQIGDAMQAQVLTSVVMADPRVQAAVAIARTSQLPADLERAHEVARAVTDEVCSRDR